MDDKRTEELTEEEFLELVLAEQEKAIAEERARRLAGKAPKPKAKRTTKIIIWLMALTLTFSTFSVILSIYSIPAIEFLKVSASLSQQDDIKTYKQAVVTISTNDSKGTGFAIREDGYIITNEHVINGAVTITVIFPDDTLYKAEVIEKNADVDLALLKIDADNIPTLTLAATKPYTMHEDVYFIGNPLAFSGIANQGTIIGESFADGITTAVVMMDAPVYKGNSGSPVLNKDGEVIGIIFATGKREPHGKVGLFIPIEAYYNELAPAITQR